MTAPSPEGRTRTGTQMRSRFDRLYFGLNVPGQRNLENFIICLRTTLGVINISTIEVK